MSNFYYETKDVMRCNPYELADLKVMAGNRDIAIADSFVEFGGQTFVREMVQMNTEDMLDYKPPMTAEEVRDWEEEHFRKGAE